MRSSTARLGSAVAAVVIVWAGAACGTASDSAGATPLPGAWRLVFVDEFDGDSLGAMWHTCSRQQMGGGCRATSVDEQRRLGPAAAQVGGGTLRLMASADAASSPDGAFPARSGMVSAGRDVAAGVGATRFSFTYGYVEARLRLPSAVGAWPAVSLQSANDADRAVVDIVEWSASRPTRLTSHVHHRIDGERRSRRIEVFGADRSGRWVIVGADWDPTRITFYVDGRMTGWVNDPELVPDTPMHLALDLAVDGAPAAAPIAGQHATTLLVDYVRVWQHYGEETR